MDKFKKKLKLVIIGGSSLSAVGLVKFSAISLDRRFIIVGTYFSLSKKDRDKSFKYYNLDSKVKNYSSFEGIKDKNLILL